MKYLKIIALVLVFLAIFSLTGCGDKAAVSTADPTPTPAAIAQTDETMQDYSKLFELNLYSDKTTYSTTDKIKIWATLKYIGKNSHIKIWHGIPYISFYISDGKDFNIGGLVEQILTSTELEKGKLYSFDYTKNGGYTAEDPKADFWRKFYAEKDLYLPEGEYTIKVGTAFSLTEDPKKDKGSMSKELKITVKPGSKDSGANIGINTGKSSKIGLYKDEIQQMRISCSLPLFQAFDTTKVEQISSVADYLNSLTPIETKLKPKHYLGMAYTIKMQLKSGTNRVFTLMGNKFFMEADRFTYELPYDEAIEFDKIVANILESNQAESGEAYVSGTIISVEKEESGRDISCVIKDNKNASLDINVKNAKIIDSTGNGNMLLHEKDIVKVFYKKGTGSGSNPITASTVYIKGVEK